MNIPLFLRSSVYFVNTTSHIVFNCFSRLFNSDGSLGIFQIQSPTSLKGL